MMKMRQDLRQNNEIRKVTIETDYLIHPEGSVLISFGQTKVIVNATIENSVPLFYEVLELVGLLQNIVCYLVQLIQEIVVKVVKAN